MTAKVSVIIAARAAADGIGAAVDSALMQDVPLEIIVAPDEPRASGDYAFLAGRDPRIRVLDPVMSPTGPGPARNRGLKAAQGDFIALLDADDTWSPHYLARLLPLAERHGAAFGRTELVTAEKRVLRAVAPAGAEADYATFSNAFASFHGLARRAAGPGLRERRWLDVLAEDVLFDLETLALQGGRAPYAGDAVYRLHLHIASTTRGAAFQRDIAAGYETLLALIASGETAVPPAEREAASAVFRNWAAMNARYVAAREADPHLDYQSFILRIQS